MDEFRKQVLLIYVPEFMKSREIRTKISVTTDEIKAFYEQHKGELAGKSQVQLQEIFLLKQGPHAGRRPRPSRPRSRRTSPRESLRRLGRPVLRGLFQVQQGRGGWFSASAS